MYKAIDKALTQTGKDFPLVINGKQISTVQTFPSYNPSDKSLLANFSKASPQHIEQAIIVAEQAFPKWSKVPFEKRAKYLQKAAKLMRQRRFEINAWLILEAGKSWAEADGDTAEAIDFLEFYSRLRFDTQVTPLKGEKNELQYLPLGIGIIIPPWNFPNAILTGMTAAAIVCGNTVLLKPASDTPIIGYKIMEIFQDAGIPAGVINFVPGSGSEIGDLLVDHPKMRFVSFTGSKEVGLRIYERASVRQRGQLWLKRVIAEMGGKDAIIVDENADLETAASAVAISAFGYQGQKCSACSRAIIHANVYEKFVPRLLERIKLIKSGDVRHPHNTLGPVINDNAYQKILSYIQLGKKEGVLLCGGGADESNGYFIEPTVFGNVPPDARIAHEEIFGPVLALIKARNFDQALEIANNTEYGLTGAVFSKNRKHLELAKEKFHVGNLYLNRKCTGAMVGAHPFGGFNMSGTDSKAGGKEYLLLFSQAKSISERR